MNFFQIRAVRAASLAILAGCSLQLLAGCTPVWSASTDLYPGRYVLPAGTVPPTLMQFPRKGRTGKGQFVTARELAIWARNRNLVLMRDCPFGNLRNDVAEVVPPRGLDFQLSAPGNGRVFLYLDLVSFRPKHDFRPYEEVMCDTKRDMIFYRNNDTSQLEKPFRLEVLINNHVRKTVYQGGGAFIFSPLRITVDREHVRDRIMNVRLLPSPGRSFFAVWDALVSIHPFNQAPRRDPDAPVSRTLSGP